MLRPFISIEIQQVPNDKFKQRNRSFVLDFVEKYEVDNGWKDHTTTANFTIPKNIHIQYGDSDFLLPNTGTYNAVLGGVLPNADIFGQPIQSYPLLMKGDIIKIIDGYRFRNEYGEAEPESRVAFSGFISSVSSDVPIKVECEDNFFLLKRTNCPVDSWSKPLLELCQLILDSTNKNFFLNESFYINGVSPYPELKMYEKPDALTQQFSIGHLDIGNISCSLLLNRMKQTYKMDSFFVGNELHFGFPIYDEETANNDYVFEFQNNIFDDKSLEYKNRDDVELSAVVTCREIKTTGKTTRDGNESTRISKVSILVYWDIVSQDFKWVSKDNGEQLPKNDGGERHEFIYAVNPYQTQPTTEQLAEYGINQLKKYYYTGFRGSFKTIGFPFVTWNDNITILDPVIADRNGIFKVKRVVRSGGINGIEQEIFLDYRLNETPKTEFVEHFMI